MVRILRSCFCFKASSIEEHHHQIKDPTSRKYFLIESLSSLFSYLHPVTPSHLFKPLCFSLGTHSFCRLKDMPQHFFQPFPSKHSTGGCWHGCNSLVIHERGRATKHLPLLYSASLGTDPLSASSIPFSQKLSPWLSKVISYRFCD